MTTVSVACSGFWLCCPRSGERGYLDRMPDKVFFLSVASVPPCWCLPGNCDKIGKLLFGRSLEQAGDRSTVGHELAAAAESVLIFGVVVDS